MIEPPLLGGLASSPSQGDRGHLEGSGIWWSRGQREICLYHGGLTRLVLHSGCGAHGVERPEGMRRVRTTLVVVQLWALIAGIVLSYISVFSQKDARPFQLGW